MNKKTLTIIGVSIATVFIISTIYLFMTKEQSTVSQKPETTENVVEEEVDVPQREVEGDVQDEQGENVIPTEVEESEILYNEDGSIDTSNWKTYRNEEYSFEVKYPVNYELRKNDGGDYLFIAKIYDDYLNIAEGIKINVGSNARTKDSFFEKNKNSEDKILKNEKLEIDSILVDYLKVAFPIGYDANLYFFNINGESFDFQCVFFGENQDEFCGEFMKNYKKYKN